MNTTTQTVENGSDDAPTPDHGIDHTRYVRSITQDMDVTQLGPSAYEVRHDGETYATDLEAPHCTCPDHEFRDARCKHLVRAALHAAFVEGVRTRFTADVVRASDDHGCADGYHACDGPTGDTLPCQTCIHGTSTGEWTVWAVLVDGRPAREVREPTPTAEADHAIATDGGQEDAGNGFDAAAELNALDLRRGERFEDTRNGDHLHVSAINDETVEFSVHPGDRTAPSSEEWTAGKLVHHMEEGIVRRADDEDGETDPDPDVATDGGVVTATSTTETTCDNCGAGDPVTLPEGHRLADEFDALCPECAGMNVCTIEGCDEAFWSHKERAEHAQSEHVDEGDRPEGASACTNCPGDAAPERRSVPDPRVDRNRQQLVCGRCGSVVGGGRFR